MLEPLDKSTYISDFRILQRSHHSLDIFDGSQISAICVVLVPSTTLSRTCDRCSIFGVVSMERRSERLAILQKLRPISYRETGVRRVFKKIRRKRHSMVAKQEHEIWKEECPPRGWGLGISGSEDSMQPCCSRDLLDQRDSIIRQCFETPPLMESGADIILCQEQSSFAPEDRPMPVKQMMAFLMFIVMVGIVFGFVSGFCTSSDTFKQAMKVQLSRQNEVLQEHLQQQIGVFREKVAGLQSYVDTLGSVHRHWEIQKYQPQQVGNSRMGHNSIQKEDFALKSAGASVVKFSKSFHSGAQICMLGFCWDYSRSPDVILQPNVKHKPMWKPINTPAQFCPICHGKQCEKLMQFCALFRGSVITECFVFQRDNSPGNCWAMDGSQGYVVVRLSQAVCPAVVALDHIPKAMSHTEEITSAPRNFSVYGFKDDFEKEEGHFLGSFVYRIDDFPMQSYKLEGANLDQFKYLLLKILSNWNHPNYTCIYGFRVYEE
ncbi:SUN domain-containing protein 2 [Varanus komodoensis]|nr:SUN domain-containing protein 2 [Varanus komodoensis]